ncbi:glycosyltransferase family 2 protein [Vibrio cyclitrophicus]|uniref:glycosyltransferase family 2 protein n=1 Tax=Vibrio cyclitrophicus TaxID=47951 RepID=UPI0039AFB3AA
MTIKFTIIIPHYNDVSGIKRLVGTLPQGDEFQFILIDDNSTCDVVELKSICSKNNIKFLLNDSGNKGAGACRNIGINHSLGEWLVFIDADDYFIDDNFSKVNSIVDSNDSDIIYFDPTSIYLDTGNKSDRHILYSKLVHNSIDSNDETIRYKYFVPWSKIVKRKLVIENEIFFDEVIASNDIMFSVKIGFHAKVIKATKEQFYCVTRQKGTLTTQTNKKVRQARLNVIIRYNKYLHQIDENDYQDSVFSIFKEYYKVIGKESIRSLLDLYLYYGLPFFPKTYHKYLYNPKLLLNRLLNKNINSHKNKEYLD